MEALDNYDAATKGKPTVEGALHAFLDTDLELYSRGGWGTEKLWCAGNCISAPFTAQSHGSHFDPVVLPVDWSHQEGASRVFAGRSVFGVITLSLAH